MERDVLVELNYTIEWSLPQQRDQSSAYGEEKDCDVEMKHQRCCPCYRIGASKCRSCIVEVIFEMVVEEAEREDHGMHNGEGCQEQESRAIVGRPAIYLLDQPELSGRHRAHFARHQYSRQGRQACSERSLGSNRVAAGKFLLLHDQAICSRLY